MIEWFKDATTVLTFFVVLCTAITGISALFIKIVDPFKKCKEKKRLKEEELQRKRISEQLKQDLPPILKEHDLEIRERYKADREKYLHDIESQVLSDIKEDLGVVYDIEQTVGTLQENVEVMAKSAKDVLREKIMYIYHKGKATKSMQIHQREALNQYYKDYKAMNGNSYIDKYYARMEAWKTLDDDYDDE